MTVEDNHTHVTCPTCGNGMNTELGRLGDRYRCSWCQSQEVLTVSSHADDQWDERTELPELYPISAWENGFLVPEPHGMEAEEIQYHHPSRQALLRKRTTIVTSVTASNGRYELKRAIIREMILGETDSSVIADFVNESKISKSGFETIAQATVRADRGNGSASTASAETDTPARQRTQ